MLELTISTSKPRGKDIAFLIAKLRPFIKSIKGIMVCEEFDGRVRLALAINESKSDYAMPVIIDAICETIIRGYKEEYLLKNINLKLDDDVQFAIFVKALCVFDKASDKEIIKKNLVFDKEIYLDSLYNFRLWELEKKWQEICELVNESSAYILAKGTLAELLKFLVSTCEAETGDVHIFYCQGKVEGKSPAGKEVFSLLYNNDSPSKTKVLGELINLAPEKIILHENMDRELEKLIKQIFDTRVSINYKNC